MKTASEPKELLLKLLCIVYCILIWFCIDSFKFYLGSPATVLNFLKQGENTSIWSLSSDSESAPDARPVKKSKPKVKKLSASKDLNPEDKKEDYDSLLDHDLESLKNQALQVKSPVENLEKVDEKSSKEMDTDINMKGGK